jgi:hypothetical protein
MSRRTLRALAGVTVGALYASSANAQPSTVAPGDTAPSAPSTATAPTAAPPAAEQVPPPIAAEPTAEEKPAPVVAPASPPPPLPPGALNPAAPVVLTPHDLQSPEQVNTRNSAYSLPKGMWSFEAGALGIGGGDVYASLGVGYGFGAGFQATINLAHAGVGLLNATVGWHFLDTRYFDLGARVGFWYGHGKWFWIARGLTQDLVDKVDVIQVPLELTASAPLTRWLELDLSAQYSYSSLFGSGSEDSWFADAQIGMRQFFLQPGARFFISDATALELVAKLPAFSTVPGDRRDINVPFKYTWSMEGGVRSRLSEGLFGTIRLHYGSVADVLYGARLYPSFDLEYRL